MNRTQEFFSRLRGLRFSDACLQGRIFPQALLWFTCFCVLGPAVSHGDTFTVAGFTFDDTLGPTLVEPVPPSTVGNYEAFAFSARFIPLSNQGNDFDVNKSVGIQLLGSIAGQNNGGTSVELGDTTFRGTLELSWDGDPGATNHAGADFVAYENGSPGGPEAYMVAVRETGATEFSDFRYEFADDVKSVPPSAGTDIGQVLSTGFDLSDFGLALGSSIDAIRVANMLPGDTVDDASGMGNVILGGGSGFAPLTGPQGAGGEFNSNGFDADLTYVGVIPALQPGDFNGDSRVDGADLLDWQRGNSPEELGTTDLDAWKANFGEGVAAAASLTSVPEPATNLLLLAGIFAMHSVRRRVGV